MHVVPPLSRCDRKSYHQRKRTYSRVFGLASKTIRSISIEQASHASGAIQGFSFAVDRKARAKQHFFCLAFPVKAKAVPHWSKLNFHSHRKPRSRSPPLPFQSRSLRIHISRLTCQTNSRSASRGRVISEQDFFSRASLTPGFNVDTTEKSRLRLMRVTAASLSTLTPGTRGRSAGAHQWKLGFDHCWRDRYPQLRGQGGDQQEFTSGN